MQHVAGVVILYNPPDDVYDNLLTYYPDLECLYVIDNSEKVNSKLVKRINKLSKIKYICHYGNKGIAYSLNEVLKLCNGKYQWLLTMDQDSSFKTNLFSDYLNCLDRLPANIYGLTSLITESADISQDRSMKLIKKCITSGTFINIAIALKVGGFDEKLFIDEVDFEFCYRGNIYGYKLLQYQRNIMNHIIGNPVEGSFLGKKFLSMNHNYIRDYYIIRNRLYVSRKYPQLKHEYWISCIKDAIKIFLVENDKKRKFKFMLKGYLDYRRGKMGRLE